jgi:hypothetical protein
MSSTTPEKFLLTWIAQMNYPVVEIQLVRKDGNTIFNFAQDRFLLTNYDEEVNPIYVSPFKYIFDFFNLVVAVIFFILKFFVAIHGKFC